MKAKERVYKGIEFVSMDDLPADQKYLLKLNTRPERIKILMDGKIVSNCIQYEKYSAWYKTVYESSVSAPGPAIEKEKPFVPVEVALKSLTH